jgi:hypothetical protein
LNPKELIAASRLRPSVQRPNMPKRQTEKKEKSIMLFKSINRRVSMVTIFGLLPLTLVAGVVREPFEIEQEGAQLIGKMEDVSRNIHQNADRLDSFARTGQLSLSTHKEHLTQIRSFVNEGLRPTLDRLTEIQQDLPEWQQDTIDQMLESAKALAANTNSAILNIRENGNRPMLLNADYREFVSQISEHVGFLVKTADAAGDYAEAHQKAIEAGLTVPTY